MASETKVGLLAGLAFIICFAVILANRGRQDAVSPQMLQLIDQGGGAPRAAEPQPPDSSPTGPVAQAKQERHAGLADVSRSEPTAQAQVGVGARLPVATIRPEAAAAGSSLQDEPGTDPRVSPVSSVGRATETLRRADTESATRFATGGTPQDVAARRAALQQRLDELDAALALQSRSGTQPAAVRMTSGAEHPPADISRGGDPPGSKPVATQKRATPSVRHKVMPGDTLSKIAAKYYGSKSRRVINAIFDANRSSLANPDTVGAGVELLLPTIEGVGAPSAVMPPMGRSPTTRPVGRPSESTEPPDQSFQWYQIQKNDRYVSIAREQLGDESRWRELYELNKDKFPDPGRIREGVRIKLPVAVAVASRKGQP